MKRQEKESIKNLDDFKRKFSSLNEKLKESILLRDRIILDILKSKEIVERRDEFNFSPFFVDGSLMKMGGNYPNFFYIFRSLAINPFNGQRIFMYDLFSPLLSEDRAYFERILNEIKRRGEALLSDLTYAEERIRYERMAKLEILVATDSVDFLKEGDLLIMDGSLTHFQKQAVREFNELLNKCRSKNITLVGVIEDIYGKELSNLDLSDKELLTGKLSIGEMIFLPYPKKKQGFSMVYLRSSNDPIPIAFDIPSEFKDRYREVASFIMFITERNGRGIPFFLDMVDREVKLTEKEIRLMGKQFLDEEIFETFFTPKRRLR